MPPDRNQARLSSRRITLADVARTAHVDRSTVSLALRNQPKIPLGTRHRIQQIAARLGYAPDPLLAAFSYHCGAIHRRPATRLIAFVSDLPDRRSFDESLPQRQAFAGASDRATELGFKVDLFFTGERQLTPARLDHVLQSRGISCVILGALQLSTSALPMHWDRYCAVAIESFHVHPLLDSITLDYESASRATVRALQAAGHTRIGFVSTAIEDWRGQHAPLAGYLWEQHRHMRPSLPPLIIADLDPLRQTAALVRWARRHAPTAALVIGSPLPTAAAQGESRGAAVQWTTLLDTGARESSRLRDAYRTVGSRAAELLALRIQTNQRGVPARRTTTLLPIT